MRTRGWRREMERLIVIRRLKVSANYNRHYRFIDVNGNLSQHISLSDFIGTESNFMYKTYTTDIWGSKNKVKYSPNKGRGYWRSFNKNGTREGDKFNFLKILKEYGIK